MTCPETRERLSALLDEGLDARERAEVEAHLAGCPDCRRELAGLRATVSLLSRVEHARAPVGFVDKVVGQAYRAPWYRRLGRLVFRPLSVKLPIEAGAVVVIALLGVYQLQSTPELKDAARPDAPAMTPSPAPPPATSPAPASQGPVPAPSKERTAKLVAPPPPATGGDRERANVARPAEEAQASPETRREGLSGPPVQEPAKPEVSAARSVAPKALDSREDSSDRIERDKKSAPSEAPAAPSILSAKQQAAPPMISGVLTVKDRAQAERALADLISRTGGARETGRRQDGSAVVVDVVVPQAGYAAFTRELAGLGSIRLEGESAEVPLVVRLSIRLSE